MLSYKAIKILYISSISFNVSPQHLYSAYKNYYLFFNFDITL